MVRVPARWVAEAVGRGLALAALWWVVSEGSTLVGPELVVLVVAVATATSLWVSPPHRRRPARPLRLLYALGWFLRACVREGSRVVWRALRPGPPVQSVVVVHRLRHPDRPNLAVLLADVISVLPGTLVLRIDEDALLVHVLDRDRLDLADLAATEQRLAGLLGSRSSA